MNSTTARSDPHAEVVLVLDFGGQTAQLIARRIREAGVLALLVRPDSTPDELRAHKPKGLVLSGGPKSVYETGAPQCDPGLFSIDVPMLGICYGMQIACQAMGSRIEPASNREFGRAALHIHDPTGLFSAVPEATTVWMSHGDQVHGLNGTFDTIASTPTCPHAAVKHRHKPIFGVQFHPEVTHTPHGADVLRNFVYEICGCHGSWTMADFLDSEIERIKEQVGDGRVICGLSGGVDSSVVAALLHRAIGDQLTCVFVDHGLLR
jgi:GMP synthase (glutamine-hydrolysing)